MGSAGQDGFEGLVAGVPGVEVRYAQGGHGALWLRPRRMTPDVRRTLGQGAYLAAVWKIVTRL